MIHKKTYNCLAMDTPAGKVVIEGPISSERLASYEFHPGLHAFRPHKEQQAALVEIAKLEEGRIIIARNKDLIIGYVTYVYPDPMERWSEGNMENLLELGAIEVIADYRNAKIGKNLLKVSMMDDAMEDYIIITTEYYWHWDLKGTGLSVWDYRKVMEKMMNAGGLEYMATDDPEISSHPANCLMVRMGKRTTLEDAQAFDRIRFQNRFMY
ncbi:acetoin utilization protein AcuA [Fictibacillus macauensis ZFHKF-1]|uniref:Acetoin utilization protein AcuA n=1 Tax=Fictibacillus macauensis ZFHKF-1 TaxID=1196324 RepID=I8J187_9BACL|nr:GNAT family N-acetyltransferase [Fictibacillus macauensis]EIT85481.1 acetoin utilization protein AcuA [Fictibacillus macauensis ZFHKF-1]